MRSDGLNDTNQSNRPVVRVATEKGHVQYLVKYQHNQTAAMPEPKKGKGKK